MTVYRCRTISTQRRTYPKIVLHVHTCWQSQKNTEKSSHLCCQCVGRCMMQTVFPDDELRGADGAGPLSFIHVCRLPDLSGSGVLVPPPPLPPQPPSSPQGGAFPHSLVGRLQADALLDRFRVVVDTESEIVCFLVA